jgi:hypothetical protein
VNSRKSCVLRGTRWSVSRFVRRSTA